MNAFKRIADIAHKTAVTGIFGSFCYITCNVAGQMIVGNGGAAKSRDEHPQAGFIEMLKDKAAEEYKKYYKTDHREWYDKDVSANLPIALSDTCSTEWNLAPSPLQTYLNNHFSHIPHTFSFLLSFSQDDSYLKKLPKPEDYAPTKKN